MKNKLSIIVTLIAAGVLLLSPAVYAQTSSSAGTVRTDIKQDRTQLRQQRTAMKLSVQDLRNDMNNLKNQFAHITQAKVTAVNGSSLTVVKNGKTYTVTSSATTKFRRHFWGSSSLVEISANDTVNVWGKWTDDAHTTLEARLIRDTSIMKRQGVFFGDVKSLTTNGFILTSKNRGDQVVTLSTGSKLVNRKEESIAQSDIKVGDRVRVKGLWDKTVKTVTEVTQVKDFSLPVTTAPTAAPTY